MPTICCAVGCKHTSGNGYCRLKRFPSDAVRSIIWENNLRRNRWVRKDWELLCECHFHFSQFEKLREDGAKKLKHNAVPTLFPTHTLALPDVIGTSFGSVDTYTSSECNFDACQFESDFVDGIKNIPPDAVPCILSTHTLVQNEIIQHLELDRTCIEMKKIQSIVMLGEKQ